MSTSLLERALPERLGRPFRWLLGSAWSSNLGDGLVLAAGPLLVASRTDEAFLVALAALLGWLPPLLFGLVAGVVTDRVDRRRLVMAMDAVRVVVLAVLAACVAVEAAPIWLVLVALFLLGTAETFADNVGGTLIPMIVRRDDLAVANSRAMAGYVGMNQLAGPPLGGALFLLGQWTPFAGAAVLMAAGVVLISRITLPPHGREQHERGSVRADIAEGVRWTWHHPAVRTLVLTILIFNVTFGAAWSVLVLYAQQRLGLGEVGFGMVATTQAVGGIIGVAAFGWLTARLTLSNLLRIGLVVETLTHLGLALATSPWVAMPVFFVFGAHAFVWGTTSVTIRQRAVPSELQGRVNSVNLIGTFGGLVVGAGIGGWLAQHWGVTAPFWFAFVGSAVFVVLIWHELRHVAHTDAQPAPDAADVGRDDVPVPDPSAADARP
ncbi:MFS transporter [Cellulomonas flavigena]|uniref:MFS transporter n=1 Tax=Cellulomonas flavigena TaxID=1711 RepID=UPI001FE053F2|nr:MFS transporter [Cellulomonas flavigena]